MGRVSRLHREAVIAGTTKPFRPSRPMRCKVCQCTTSDKDALQHAKECWGIDYPNLASIPFNPPQAAFDFYRQNHPQNR